MMALANDYLIFYRGDKQFSHRAKAGARFGTSLYINTPPNALPNALNFISSLQYEVPGKDSEEIRRRARNIKRVGPNVNMQLNRQINSMHSRVVNGDTESLCYVARKACSMIVLGEKQNVLK